jgi:hypothetical protein
MEERQGGKESQERKIVLQEFVLDNSAIEQQLKELKELSDKLFSENPPESFVRELSRLPSDVVISYGPTALGTDGIHQTVIFARFGSSFDRLGTAMRTGEFIAAAHKSENITT